MLEDGEEKGEEEMKERRWRAKFWSQKRAYFGLIN